MEGKEEDEMSLSGFSMTDPDHTGRVTFESLSRVMDIYLSKFARETDIPGYVQLNKAGLLSVLLVSDLHIHEALYRTPLTELCKRPVKLHCQLSYVGSTSYAQTITLKDGINGETLAVQTNMDVAIDKQTRKPRRLLTLFYDVKRESKNQTRPEFKRLKLQELPKQPYVYHFETSDSDMDKNMHITRNVYIKHIWKCFKEAFASGYYTSLNGDLAKVKGRRCTVLYVNETFAGEKMSIASWEDGQNKNKLNFVIKRGNDIITECTLEFYPLSKSKM